MDGAAPPQARSQKGFRVSAIMICVPAYNEARCLPRVLRHLAATCGNSARILVVDDGSTDGTGDVARAASGVRVVAHARNEGYGAALRTCFGAFLDSDCDRLVTCDADGQHLAEDVGRVAKASECVDIASGSRLKAESARGPLMPPHRRLVNEALCDALAQRTGYRLSDALCGLKGYSRRAARAVTPTLTGYAAPIEVLVRAWDAGLTLVEVGVSCVYLHVLHPPGHYMRSMESARAYLEREFGRATVARLAETLAAAGYHRSPT